LPLNSIQNYVVGLLDGMVVQGVEKPLTAYITPPQVEDMDGPRLYVWGGRMRSTRQTMPRINTPAARAIGHSGFKHFAWTVDCWISYETIPGTGTVDQEFAVLLDAIMAVLYSTEMPVFISDPTTGMTTQVLSIGEEFDLEVAPERTPQTLRMLYYTARLSLDVYEAVQA
jgi:hypothetical protein